MNGRNDAVRAWLEFAAEMGIDALPRKKPARRRAAVATATAAAPAAAERTANAPAGEASGAAAAFEPMEKMRRSLAAKGRGPARPAPGSGPPQPATPPAVAPAVVAAVVLPRLATVDPALLAVAGDPDPGMAARGTLEQTQAVLGDCRRCKLHPGRTKIVFGSGNPEAELMFVGEAPGRDEDLQGLPFVGRAGQLLTDIIKAIGMTREEVYIANVIKCRPPDNRTPEADEIASCRGFLYRQLQAIRPRVVVALGRPAAETLIGKPVSISEIRGQEVDFFGARLIPTFHPAYLLRNPAKKREVWEDMKRVRDLLSRD